MTAIGRETGGPFLCDKGVNQLDRHRIRGRSRKSFASVHPFPIVNVPAAAFVRNMAGEEGDMSMRYKMLAAAAAAGSMALACPANAAQYLINFNTNQPLLGPSQSGTATITTSNTLTTSPLGAMGYLITSITGILNGAAITGLSGFQGSDNYYFTLGSFVDNSGLGFTTAGGTSASLYFASTAQRYQLTTTSPFSTGYVTATSALVPSVPEPAAWAMMLAGFGGIGFALRRRPRPTAAVSFA